ncbi:natural cytotoxicity triggering receptor 3 ligand 1 isoform X2 [Odocoileus virginianus]|uniref:Natural cytotoxicity triggering receptor 3 ligand 1 isoform X2 n=1 Tax=Odocoileus virginianus TaxID=9874 RepID=A0A6J0YI62_ODOVR
MAKRAAGRVQWGSGWLLRVLMSLLELEQFQLIAGLLQVEMAGRTQMVFLNENVTISCKIPGSPHLDINSIGITWFQKTGTSETDTKLFEYFGNHREASQRGASVSLQSLQRGDASLQLPGVRLEDAGEYRCELVVTPQKAQGTVRLEVVAPPVSNLSEQVMMKDNEDKHILCISSGFYPRHINITWKKWTQKDPQFREFSQNITTDHIVENEDGTFNITSHLRLKPSQEDNGTIYQCVVWHVSLPTIQSFNFHLILHPESEKKTYQFYIDMSILIIIGLIIIGLIIIGLIFIRPKRSVKCWKCCLLEDEERGSALSVVHCCPVFMTGLRPVVCQAPLSVKFSKQEHWNGLPFPSPGALANPEIEPKSPAFQADPLLLEPLQEAGG